MCIKPISLQGEPQSLPIEHQPISVESELDNGSSTGKIDNSTHYSCS